VNRNKPNYYGIIPASVRYDPEIPHFAKLIYAEISALSNKEGFCWASNDYFAYVFETTARTVQRAIEALEARGYIRRHIENKTSRKIYINMTEVSPPYDNFVMGTNDKKVVHNNTSNNNINNNIAFEKFWNIIKKKKNKNDARRAFAKIKCDLKPEELAERYNMQFNTKDAKYVPYPSRWLRNESWNESADEERTPNNFYRGEKIYRDEKGFIISKEEHDKLN
tara:strand:- start:24053 stop:24721 length:669 start_codon:yes stop_codon:yes gene_type:complete